MRLVRITKIVSLLVRITYYQLAGNRQQLGQTLYAGFNELGGLYVKFLQILLLRSDFFEHWQGIEHLKVYEDVATEKLDIATLLKKELGDSAGEVRLDGAEPFAAGSFGQVYKATLPDGSKVIVKALRPTLMRYLKFDLRLISIAVRFLNWLKPGAMLDLKMLFLEFRSTTLGETDYRREAAFGASLHERYTDHPHLVIPRTYTHLCTRHLLVQEYVGGISAAQLLDLARQGHDPAEFVRTALGSDLQTQLKTLGFEILYEAMDGHSIHADPHPGNIKLLDKNRVSLIDFGISGAPPADKAATLNLIREYRKIYADEFDVRNFSLSLMRFFAADLVAAIEGLTTHRSRLRRNQRRGGKYLSFQRKLRKYPATARSRSIYGGFRHRGEQGKPVWAAPACRFAKLYTSRSTVRFTGRRLRIQANSTW
jgi:predicted unusual protein kinase regulating ubiquinone biosynthesis (AarF/ABC1/UbiB family)